MSIVVIAMRKKCGAVEKTEEGATEVIVVLRLGTPSNHKARTDHPFAVAIVDPSNNRSSWLRAEQQSCEVTF
jgi:hypothetical protein